MTELEQQAENEQMKHLPSDIDNLTRRELVEIYHIHAEEYQLALKQIAELGAKLALTKKDASYYRCCAFSGELPNDYLKPSNQAKQAQEL